LSRHLSEKRIMRTAVYVSLILVVSVTGSALYDDKRTSSKDDSGTGLGDAQGGDWDSSLGEADANGVL
jgi:hypothetical protein